MQRVSVRAYHSELASVETGAENDFITDTITRIKNGFTKQRRLEQCGDKLDNCFNYDDNECVGKYAPWAKINCAYRCGYCPGCVDTKDNCWNYDDSKCLGIYSPWAKLNCPYRCGYCPVPYHANITESHKPLTLHTKSPLRLNTTSLPMLSNGDGFWIGGTDEVIEGVWVWAASGKPLTYSNFYKSVPNIDKNANPNDENCLEIVQWTGNVGKWNDNNCSEESHFICEMEYV
ncbi:unnamed protein product [Mytilus edulis]|uniref:C-type lectin domain-containing protein n=1 Tax=Mytilus edulis TaxID=6550 RepID=A0A8S3RF74_MYTED|nr:unnamed protein product [Mytilus edulis]